MTRLIASILIGVVSAFVSLGHTAGAQTIDRLVTAQRPAKIAAFARTFGLQVVDQISATGTLWLRGRDPVAVQAFESALAHEPSVSAIESPTPIASATVSGPSSVPIINPSGSVTSIQSQPSFQGLSTLLGSVALGALVSHAPITVAVLDTGADLTHPVLAGHVHPASFDFLSPATPPSDVGNGIDDDGDGVVDPGYGHGTHVAGLIAATVPNSQIMVLRIADDEGRGDVFAISRALVWATDHGARVINLSFGSALPSGAIAAAIDYAEAAGALIVTSAGNGGGASPSFPTGHGHVVTIAATDPGPPIGTGVWELFPQEATASFSNRGAFIDFAAIGAGVQSIYPQNRYATWSGTSMAAGVFSSAAALVLSLVPQASRQQLLQMLADASFQPPSSVAGTLGAGRVDTVAAALRALVESLGSVTPAPDSDLSAIPMPSGHLLYTLAGAPPLGVTVLFASLAAGTTPMGWGVALDVRPPLAPLGFGLTGITGGLTQFSLVGSAPGVSPGSAPVVVQAVTLAVGFSAFPPVASGGVVWSDSDVESVTISW